MDRLSEVLDILSKYLPVARYVVTTTPDVGWDVFPAVVKANTTTHKTDESAVILNIRNRDELRRSIESLLDRFDEVMVQEQIKGVEVFLGGKVDPSFGPTVTLGLGGILVEIYRDTSTRLAPLTGADVMDMVEELRGKALIKGYRGMKTNFEALVRAVIGFSRLMEDLRPKTAEVNPLILNERGAFAVDGRIFF